MADSGYACTLNEASKKKALEELKEDPKERLGAVEALRKWVNEQPHLTAPTDTNTLLRFLRTAKFSQLKARQNLESYCSAATKYPDWFRDVDTHNPKMQRLFNDGYCYLLPGVDKDGCKVLMFSMANTNPKDYTVAEDIRSAIAMVTYLGEDENIQVNGCVLVMDLTGCTMAHITKWGLEDSKKWSKCWQGVIPGRFKKFHYYNHGALFDMIMSLFKPFMKKKYVDRIQLHNTLESLYEYVPKSMLPVEYLPDDYKGPNGGTTAELIEAYKESLSNADFHDKLLRFTAENSFHYDEAKKDKGAQVASFRKLNVD